MEWVDLCRHHVILGSSLRPLIKRVIVQNQTLLFCPLQLFLHLILPLPGELVALLEYFGTLSGIPHEVLGLTVLAWGNSIGDLSTNCAMTKRGLSNMAMTACFAGPIINLLMALSLGFMRLLSAEHVSSISVQLAVSSFTVLEASPLRASPSFSCLQLHFGADPCPLSGMFECFLCQSDPIFPPRALKMQSTFLLTYHKMKNTFRQTAQKVYLRMTCSNFCRLSIYQL